MAQRANEYPLEALISFEFNRFTAVWTLDYCVGGRGPELCFGFLGRPISIFMIEFQGIDSQKHTSFPSAGPAGVADVARSYAPGFWVGRSVSS